MDTLDAFDAEVVVKRRVAARPESGWALVSAMHGSEEVTLVGPLAHVEERDRVHIAGKWVVDRRYGKQVRVHAATPVAISEDAALLAYMRRVKGVGRMKAQQLLDKHGTGVLAHIDADPARAFAQIGLRGSKGIQAVHSWDALRSARELHLLLAPEGLAYLVPRVQKELGDRAYRIVRRSPYELTSVFGVGFRTADRIARRAGIEAGTPGRARAGVMHVLTEAETDGSTCLPLGLLVERARELLGPEAIVDEAFVEGLVDHGDIDITDGFVFRAATARLEKELARRVRTLLDAKPALDPIAAAIRGAAGLTLTQEQEQAVRDAFTSRFSLITGGPGTGKTATIRAITGAAFEQDASVLLMAPTGRAAVRMHEATGQEASTVHSALGWIPGQGPERDEEHPLEVDLIVLDEASMANLELFVFLLRAVGDHTHVVCVGDADQLAPVGAGKPFAELIGSGLVPTVALGHIFRQAAGSMIVQGAHAVKAGQAPSFTRVDGMQHDLFVADRPDPRAALEEIVSLVADRLPKRFGVDPIAGIQVFAPVYRGALGIDALNTALRDALNPRGTPVMGGRLRENDKLMITGRNLHDVGLMNGTLLRLRGTLKRDDEEQLLLEADDGSSFTLAGEDRDRLQLAYACSVHKGQGIELPIAVVVCHPAAGGSFLRRELLYTAITRARLATVIVGTRQTIATAAARTDTQRRYSRLTDRLVVRAPRRVPPANEGFARNSPNSSSRERVPQE